MWTLLGPTQSVLIRDSVLISGVVHVRTYDNFGTTRSVPFTLDVHISGVSARQGSTVVVIKVFLGAVSIVAL